jgi:hypothetical protein
MKAIDKFKCHRCAAMPEPLNLHKKAIDKLRCLCCVATPGPWLGNYNDIYKDSDILLFAGKKASTTDAYLIMEARNSLPALIELVEAYQWVDECRDFRDYGRWHLEIQTENADAELDATVVSAYAAVSVAWKKLEDCV